MMAIALAAGKSHLLATHTSQERPELGSKVKLFMTSFCFFAAGANQPTPSVPDAASNLLSRKTQIHVDDLGTAIDEADFDVPIGNPQVLDIWPMSTVVFVVSPLIALRRKETIRPRSRLLHLDIE